MNFYLSDNAKCDLYALPQHIRKRISEKIRFFAGQTDPLNFAKYIAVYKLYRFRIGDYRVLFSIKESNIIVTNILRRDKAYD
jgi:mRNA-degrading endonuclease RelE of RelBE toxin-antitoxin system